MKKTVFLVTTQIKNFIQTYNNQLKNAYKNVADDENSYLVLLYEDLAKNLKDKDKFIDDYIAFAEKYDLPYTFFPYYGSFNRVMLQISHGIPHPFFDVTVTKMNDEKINVVHQIAPGCLILNVNKLKSINFKFDQNYPTLFYIQDLVEQCYRKKLWISNCWYFDRFESWKELKDETLPASFTINAKNFQDEQKKYFETFKDCKFKDPNQFMEDLKKWSAGEDIPVETNSVITVPVQNTDNISISVPEEIVKKDVVLNVNNLSTTIPSAAEQKTQPNMSTEPIVIKDNEVLKSFTESEKIQEMAKLAQIIDENTKKDNQNRNK